MELIVRHRDREEKVALEATAEGYRVRVGEAEYAVGVGDAGGLMSLVVDGRQYEVAVGAERDDRYVVSSSRGLDTVVLMDPLTHLARQGKDDVRSGAGRVEAYMPGRVVAVLVAEGDAVEAGQGLVVLEAMKMENEIQAEGPGVVRKVFVEQGQAVEGGDILFEIV